MSLSFTTVPGGFTGNNLPVSSTRGGQAVDITSPEFHASAAAGLIPGATVQLMAGHASGLTTAVTAVAPVTICDQGTLYPFLAAAATLQIVSTSALDTAAGTGLRTVLVKGLDAGFNPISETLTLNGVTPVNTVNQYLRVNKVQGITAGTGTTNAGIVTLSLVGGGSPQAVIPAGIGEAQAAVFTVPTGFVALLTGVQYSINGSATAAAYGEAAVAFRANGNTCTITGVRASLTSGFPYSQLVGINTIRHSAGTDFSLRMIQVGQAATEISGSFTMMLLDLNYFPTIYTPSNL